MNYKLDISYIGTNFFGFAKQTQNLRTIQSTIEDLLSDFFKSKVILIGCSRTDKYVHAIKHISNFYTKEIFNINKLFYFLKNNLPSDIFLKKLEKAKDNFNSRFHSSSKTYLYRINDKKFNLFDKDFIYQYNKKLNIVKLRKLSKLFIGEKNFLSFSTTNSKNTIRKINWIKIKKRKKKILIYINANSFLRNMVRMIVASILFYSNNFFKRNEIINFFNYPKKGSSINKVPGCGLYLLDVYF